MYKYKHYIIGCQSINVSLRAPQNIFFMNIEAVNQPKPTGDKHLNQALIIGIYIDTYADICYEISLI